VISSTKNSRFRGWNRVLGSVISCDPIVRKDRDAHGMEKIHDSKNVEYNRVSGNYKSYWWCSCSAQPYPRDRNRFKAPFYLGYSLVYQAEGYFFKSTCCKTYIRTFPEECTAIKPKIIPADAIFNLIFPYLCLRHPSGNARRDSDSWRIRSNENLSRHEFRSDLIRDWNSGVIGIVSCRYRDYPMIQMGYRTLLIGNHWREPLRLLL